MKKVFIGVLAALMLFAFTACENNAPQTPIMGNQIEGVELVSAPDYIIGIGDDIDPAEVKLNVIKNDGSKVSYTGTELNLKAPTTLSTINNCAVTYGNLTFYVNIPAYNWDEITAVDLSGATTKTIKTTDTKISTDGITVTVSYAKGTRSGVAIEDVVKNGDKITFSENKTVADFGFKDGQEINMAEALKKEEVSDTISDLLDKATGSWDVTVDDSALAISDVDLEQIFIHEGTPYEVFAAGTTKNTLDKVAFAGTATVTADGTSKNETFYYLGADVTDKITLVNKNEVADPDYTYNTGWTIILQNYTDTYAFTKVGTLNVEAIVAYTAEGETVKSEEISVPVEVIKDYPTTFKAPVIGKDSDEEPLHKDEWAWEESIDPADFEFVVTQWASGLGETGYKEGEAPALSGKWTSNPATVEKYAPASINVTFTYSGDHGKAEPNKTVSAPVYAMSVTQPTTQPGA